MKNGLVLEGGALRGVFSSGVLEVLQEHGLTFSYVVGVSAGSGNLFNWLSEQPKRQLLVCNPPKKITYYGLPSFFRTGKIMDLDKMFFEYPFREEFPYDWETCKKNLETVGAEIVVTDCETGKPVYLSEKEDLMRLLSFGKASCSIPLLSKPVEIDGRFYMDGSVVDSIPMCRALEMGCDKVVVIETRRAEDPPSDFTKYKGMLNRKYGKKYPALVEACLVRSEMYAAQRKRLAELEEEGKAFVIRPEVASIGRFSSNSKKIEEFYLHGRAVMEKQIDRLVAFLKEEVPAKSE